MSLPDFDVFVAPDTAFAAFEEAVLAARCSVLGSFRIFDMRTPLVSASARAVGQTWFDLLLHVARRGVALDIVISDFDPVLGSEPHRLTWGSVKQGAALAELAGPDAQVRVRAAMHPARAGAVPWLAFLPAVWKRKRDLQGALSDAARQEAPGLGVGAPTMHPATHHQKLAVIDDDTLYLGGLDLNARRYDTADHSRPAEQTWSDVQIMLRNDPAVAEARTHIRAFEDVVHRRQAPPAAQHLVRTLSCPRRVQLPFLSPRTLVAEVEEVHRTAFQAARHLIHIETQFMRSRPLAEVLARAAQARPELTLTLILPALPEDAAFVDAAGSIGLETRYGLALEREALAMVRDGFGARATIATPVQPVMAARDGLGTRGGSPIIYVHNKVLVQDDALAVIGSGNLNGRSLHWDTEVGVRITAPERIARVRRALHRHWWRDDEPEPEWLDLTRQQALWHGEIRRNDVRRPEARKGFLVSHDASVHSAQGQDLPMVTEDIV